MWNHWSRLELHICVSREKNRMDSRQEIYWWRSRPTLGMCWRRHMFILPTRENKGNQRNLENKERTRKPWSKYGANWNDTNVEQFRYQKKEFIWIFPFEGNRIWTMEVQRGKCNYSMLAGSGRKNIYLVIRILYIDFFEVSLQTKHGRLHYDYRTRSACYQSWRYESRKLAGLERRKGGRGGEAGARRTSPRRGRESGY